MSTTYKFKVTIIIKEGGGSRTIYPIIEASSSTEAVRIAKAQFIMADVRSASKVN